MIKCGYCRCALPCSCLRRRLLRLWARCRGKILVSDYVEVKVTLSKPQTVASKFNPASIIGKEIR